MSQMTHDTGDGAEYESDFRQIINSIMESFSEFNMDIEVINDQTQLRVIFTPKNIPSEEAQGLVESIVDSALDNANTEFEHGVDIFETEGDYMSVFAPEREA